MNSSRNDNPPAFNWKFGLSLQPQLSRTDYYYKNIQRLGTGGNSVVYLALATSGPNQGNFFAVKIFRKLAQKERRERFLEETEFLKKCDHPSIMRVYDDGVFQANNETYPLVIAEYLPYTLDQIIRAGEASLVEKLGYTLQLLSGLTYLANLETPVIHRDIKPQNIFIRRRSCVLGDFGLMKKVDREEELDRDIFKASTGAGMPFLYPTPDLVSYARNEADISTKSDVFQLGTFRK